MTDLKTITERYPIVAYVLLCFGITWSFWFAIPLITGTEKSLINIYMGIGLGPAYAALILEHIRGTSPQFKTRRWWAIFSIVFLIVATINISGFIPLDTSIMTENTTLETSGFSSVGIIGSLLTALSSGFILASLVCNRSCKFATIMAWRVSIRWWLVAFFLSITLSLLSLGIAIATGGIMPEPMGIHFPVLTRVFIVIRSTLFTFLVVAVGEEPGWRGWMLPELQKRFNPLISSVLLGFVWGLWHFPLFINGLLAGGPVGALYYLWYCPILAILYTWLYNCTGKNLLMLMIFHSMYNNTSSIVPDTPWFILLLLILALVLVITNRMWRKQDVYSENT